jgi:hypothetical protein
MGTVAQAVAEALGKVFALATLEQGLQLGEMLERGEPREEPG